MAVLVVFMAEVFFCRALIRSPLPRLLYFARLPI